MSSHTSHDVTLDETTGPWMKYTQKSSCGYTVSWNASGTAFMHNASPLDYFQRLICQNDTLGDDIPLAGLWQALPHQWRIVTSPPGLRADPSCALCLPISCLDPNREP